MVKRDSGGIMHTPFIYLRYKSSAAAELPLPYTVRHRLYAFWYVFLMTDRTIHMGLPKKLCLLLLIQRRTPSGSISRTTAPTRIPT